MRATAVWFGIYCLWAVVFFTVIWPLAKGRIPTDQHAQHRRSPDWAALRMAVARRGERCAACGQTDRLHLHHWDTRSYGYERPWQLVLLCERHHLARYRFSVHWWSDWIFSDLERGLPLTTGLVVGAGKLKRLGRRAPHATTVRRAA